MAITGNKGEWSEIYTFLKLLGEGEVYAGDQNLNRILDLVYPIVSIIRQEREEKYKYSPIGSEIVIFKASGEVILRTPADVFLSQSEILLEKIKENDGAFSVPLIEEFMHRIYCNSLKAKSSDKTDIRIVLHDKRTRLNSEMGFSIKSQLGGNSTLLNASEATNFTFKIVGVNLTNEEIESINNINPPRNKVIERYNAILRKGGSLQYSHIDNDVFERNIRMLDGDMAHLVASMLIVQLDEGISAFPQLIATMSETNPLKFRGNNLIEIYTYKSKHLLTSAALGMMPATLWTGRFDANGGYLVVKNDGDIVCYHFYDRNRFEDYLFTNAYLERASTTRHKYAMVYKDLNGDLMFKLNLQIRLR